MFNISIPSSLVKLTLYQPHMIKIEYITWPLLLELDQFKAYRGQINKQISRQRYLYA